MRLFRLLCRIKYFWAWLATCVGVRDSTKCRLMPRQSPCAQGHRICGAAPRNKEHHLSVARAFPSFWRPTRKRRCSSSLHGMPKARRKTCHLAWNSRHAPQGGRPSNDRARAFPALHAGPSSACLSFARQVGYPRPAALRSCGERPPIRCVELVLHVALVAEIIVAVGALLVPQKYRARQHLPHHAAAARCSRRAARRVVTPTSAGFAQAALVLHARPKKKGAIPPRDAHPRNRRHGARMATALEWQGLVLDYSPAGWGYYLQKKDQWHETWRGRCHRIRSFRTWTARVCLYMQQRSNV